MFSKSKHLLILITVSFVMLGLPFLVCCKGQIADGSFGFDKLEITSTEEVVVVAVGDVMLSRYVGERIRTTGNPKAPFLKTAEVLKEADITFCNLESPFYKEEPTIEDALIFGAAPETIEGLKYAGFDVVSLANNHFGDQGVAGMLFTLSHLNENGIEFTGAGENETKAREPRIIERNGVKFAFLGYSDFKLVIRDGYGATSEKPGVARLTKENLRQDIQEARKRAHVVIVSVHWGIEYEQAPSKRQRMLAHLAVDYGATLVLGHHPHVIQPWEEYKNGYIFYSLGNFVFDQMQSEETRTGLIARIFFEGAQIKEVETTIVVIHDFHQPRPEDWEA